MDRIIMVKLSELQERVKEAEKAGKCFRQQAEAGHLVTITDRHEFIFEWPNKVTPNNHYDGLYTPQE